MSDDLDLTARDAYPYWSHDRIRFGDLDRYGHVNNAAFVVYCETGRVDFLERMAPGSCDGRGEGWVIVRLEIDYRAQGHYPGDVDIGSRVLKMGRSSVTMAQGLFVGDTCIATSIQVVVWADPANNTSLPLPEAVRQRLSGFTGA